MHQQGTWGTMMAVTRTGGAVGKATVDYVFAPTLYTNYMNVNWVETNIYNEDFDTNGLSLGFTNIDLIYTNTFHWDQDNEWGEWVYLPVGRDRHQHQHH